MKTIVWATLTANGNYARATAAHPPRKQALSDFAANAKTTRNFIVGRRTFEEFRADPSRSAEDAAQAFAELAIVVVSGTDPRLPGVEHAASPAGALKALEQRGYTSALVAGGETLINAFLAEDLVDELVINIAPSFDEEGLRLKLPAKRYQDLKLLGMQELGDGVAQLRYAIDRTQA